MAKSEQELSSLLDAIIEKKTQSSESKQIIYTLVYVSRLSSSDRYRADKRELGAHYEQLATSCQSRYQVDGPTGLLLVYPLHCIHIVEGTHEMILTIIEDLKRMKSERGPLVDTRLLSLASNVTRLYSQWSHRVLPVAVLSKGETYETSEPVEQVVGTILSNLYQLGLQLGKLSQTDLKRYLDELKTTAQDLLPRQDVLEYCLNSAELMTPSSYTQRYSTPMDITLDSEVVWPLPVRLFPYS